MDKVKTTALNTPSKVFKAARESAKVIKVAGYKKNELV